MTSRKSEKKLDLKVKRVLKTNVRGGVAQYQGTPVAGGVIGVAMSEEGQTQVGSGKASKGSSYPSRLSELQIPTGGIIKGSV
jgi:hypothetical protein